MHRNFCKRAMAMAVVGGIAILGGASPVRAVPVTYSTVGSFAAPGTAGPSVLTVGGVTITFLGVTSSTVDAPSQASFGQFQVTTATQGTPAQNFSSPFTLRIFQTAPETVATPAEFAGQLTGTLSFFNSQAFVTFAQPLARAITGQFTTTYTIVEADRDAQGTPVAGRTNLNPPSTNAGLSTVEGFITTTAAPAPIPEPSTLLMGALAAPALLICLRRKGKVTV